ncbi:AraC family transcriptional regulator [Sphingomonas sp. BK580]|uniref:helix-turn-helix domain-containing protein n=1 Tax=Sphingomonas sp. BK580 TaxID=2586972 RepID=UPI00161CE3D4
MVIAVHPEIRRTGAGVTIAVDHAHLECEFNLVLFGSGVYHFDDKAFDIGPGSLIWLAPGKRHRLERSADLDMWVATISDGALDNSFLSDVLSRPHRTLSAEDAVALDRLLRHVSQDAAEPRLYNAGIYYAFRTAWRMTMMGVEGRFKRPHSAVIKIVEILSADPSVTTLGVAAERCGLSADYVGHLLPQQLGVSFKELLNRTRLNRFFSIYPTSRNILTAALDAGFGSYTQFYRVFCDIVGQPPRAWLGGDSHVPPLDLMPFSTIVTRKTDSEDGVYPFSFMVSQDFTSLRRWFGSTFPTCLERALGEESAAPPIATGICNLSDLRRFEEDLVDEVSASNSENALMLADFFRRQNVLATYAQSHGQWQLGTSDLAMIVGLDFVLGLMLARSRPLPSREQILPICYRFREAFCNLNTFANATSDEVQRTSMAAIVSSVLKLHALRAAMARESRSTFEQIAACSRSVMLATVGIDPLSTAIEI